MAQPNNDVDLRGVGLHSIEAGPTDPPMVRDVSSALERVKGAVESFTEQDVKVREDVNLSFPGKVEAIKRRAAEAIAVVAGAEAVLDRAERDLETRRSAVLPGAMVERAVTMDGGDAAAVVRRESRAAEVRAHLRGLDDMNKVQFVRGLTGEARDAAFDAIVAVASAPVPIKLPGDALEQLARRWFETHEPERVEAIASVERAAGILKAATTRARRGLHRCVEAMEGEASRRGPTLRRGRAASATG